MTKPMDYADFATHIFTATNGEEEKMNEQRPVPPCPCECNSGGFCGGCGHAGCGGRR